jgi:uncharacterized membrane protein
MGRRGQEARKMTALIIIGIILLASVAIYMILRADGLID